MKNQKIADAVERDGFVVIKDVLSRAEVQQLLEQVSQVESQDKTRRRHGKAYAVRNLLTAVPAIQSWATQGPWVAIATHLLGPQARPVKGTLFDKHEAANWKVPWHQDQVITVQNYSPEPNFGPWSMKEGLYAVQPPIEVLEQMIAVRIHLDPCSILNGALKVIPGSHRHGKLSAHQISEYRKRPSVVCEMQAGDPIDHAPLTATPIFGRLTAEPSSSHPFRVCCGRVTRKDEMAAVGRSRVLHDHREW